MVSSGLLRGRFMPWNSASTGDVHHSLANWAALAVPGTPEALHSVDESTGGATEEPMFFGPADGPLFGVLHLPADNCIRGAVLICGSLGKEGMDSARLQRVVADTLARRGFAVLRFDYLGTGDSAYSQGRDDAVADWLHSIAEAAAYLTSLGIQSITAIGIRAGALLLNEYLADQPTSLENVVYFDPVGTGRRYLREHTTLYRLAAGADATVPGITLIIGARLGEAATSKFGALRFDPSRHPTGGTLLVTRSTETESRITDFAATDGVETITGEGLAEFAQSADVMVPMPLQAADAMIDWIDLKASDRRTKVTPVYSRSVVIPAAEPDGISVVEQIERIGPRGLFGIRAVPERAATATGKAVLFFATANDSHHGPSREWVELSRQVAASGSQAVRWARAGLGSDGNVSRDQWQAVYSTTDIADAVDAARHTSSDPHQLELVGVCSGSWYAAHVARAVGAGHIVMVNQAMWSWSVLTTLPWQWNLRNSLRTAHVSASEDWTTERARKKLVASLKPARNRLILGARRLTPRWLHMLLGRIGLMHAPEVVLTALSRGGTDITVLASPWDVEQFTAKGGLGALTRLDRTKLVQTTSGDHSGYHPAILSAIRGVVLEHQV